MTVEPQTIKALESALLAAEHAYGLSPEMAPFIEPARKELGRLTDEYKRKVLNK